MLVRLIALNACRQSIAGSLGLLLAILTTGCQGTGSKSRPEAAASGSSMVIQAGHIQETAKPAIVEKGTADMAAAEDLYRQENYSKAEDLFDKVANDTKNSPLLAEKARFFEAECKRLRKRYPDAMSTYNRLLIDFQYGVFREKAVGRMFEIANYWLDDTRKQMDLEREKAEGKRWFVGSNFFHTDRTKPFFDEEGHALKMLEQVYYNDPTGPFAEKALFLSGYVHFHRQEFREADQVLTQLIDMGDKLGKKSDLRDQAIELAILAKNNASGGPDYDGRKAAESLKLIHQAKMSSPELVANRGEFLDNQAAMIRYIQAEKDFNVAEFYRRTGHPASAWFYYELVRRRYHGTEFHDKAVARMGEIHGDLTEQQKQSAFVKTTRQTWNKWALGHDTPTLKEGQEIPALPDGKLPEHRDNPVVPVGGQRAVPNELMPR